MFDLRCGAVPITNDMVADAETIDGIAADAFGAGMREKSAEFRQEREVCVPTPDP